MQMAIQLAHWRLHKEFVATYETAHTRLFHHGRTETSMFLCLRLVQRLTRATHWSRSRLGPPTPAVRTTSLESVAFCKAMTDEKFDATERYEKLRAAVKAHGSYVKDCMLGQGIDRHLLGLQIVSEVRTSPIPQGVISATRAVYIPRSYMAFARTCTRARVQIMAGDAGSRAALFTDPGFLKSRKFALSTSNISMGYAVQMPCRVRMCATARPSVPSTSTHSAHVSASCRSTPSFGGYAPFFKGGYGVCYSLHDNMIHASITHAKGTRTDASALRDAIRTALVDVYTLCAECVPVGGAAAAVAAKL
ncbi:hypothetical protein EON66_00105 [archaeon]|nr:MAG: hypothetical protein EON66_00105 [archaeon]